MAVSAPADLRAVEPTSVPMALAALHRELAPGACARVWLPPTTSPDHDRENCPTARDADWPFGRAPKGLLADVLEGAGLSISRRRSDRPTVVTRSWTLPDTTGPSMRLLVSGLNPSPAAADHGIGFARPGNRFWPAALAAGLVSRDRDPDHALAEHGVGMTDLVKRTTRRAEELSASEYRAGLRRLDRIVSWLGPAAVCFVGLAGWRAAHDGGARPGWQQARVGDRPVYVMPSTSGLNASSSLDDLTDHLIAVVARL